MYVQQLLEQVEAGRIPTVVVIAGSERFFVDRALRALRNAVVGEGTPGFNEDIFEGKTAPAARLIQMAGTTRVIASPAITAIREVDTSARAEPANTVHRDCPPEASVSVAI